MEMARWSGGLDPRIAELLRAAAQDEALPTLEFLRKCEQVGMQALERRDVIQSLRRAAEPVCYPLTLAAYIEEIASAAGIDDSVAKPALGLLPEDGWELLNYPTPQTKEVVELLGVDQTYARQALRMACLDQSLDMEFVEAARDGVSEVKDPGWACREIERHIGDALRSGNASIAARMEECDKKIAVLFSDEM